MGKKTKLSSRSEEPLGSPSSTKSAPSGAFESLLEKEEKKKTSKQQQEEIKKKLSDGKASQMKLPAAAKANGGKKKQLKTTQKTSGGGCPNCCCLFFLVILLGLLSHFSGLSRGAVDTVQERLIPGGLLVENPNRPGLTYLTDYPEESNTGDEVSRVSTKKEKKRKPQREYRPVVIIPGFLGTSLEVWEMEECLKSNLTSRFRQKVFTPQMVVELLRDPECFLRHISLGENGTDPSDDIRIRASETGVDSVDYLVPGFWLFAKIFINLVDIEMEPSQFYVAGYDWRLDPLMMEARDGYFTKLKNQIEYMKQRHPNQKVVVATHSYGGLVFTAFVKWIEEQQEQAAADNNSVNHWIDDHVYAFYEMGGPLLGLPKATAAMISGEFKDTAMLPATAKLMVNANLPLRERAKVFRSWHSLKWMQPKVREAYPDLVTVTDRSQKSSSSSDSATPDVLTLLESMELMGDVAGAFGQESLRNEFHSYAAAGGEKGSAQGGDMPPFPVKKTKMKVYCVYGEGYETEIGHHYQNISHQRPSRIAQPLMDLVEELSVAEKASAVKDQITHSSPALALKRLLQLEEEYEEGRGSAAASVAGVTPGGDGPSIAGSSSSAEVPTWSERAALEDDDLFFQIDSNQPSNGVRNDVGDKTVPLVSLGYMCHSNLMGWRTIVENPDQNVVALEVPNHSKNENTSYPLDPRGGDFTGDHVDILGNRQVITELMHIVTHREHLIPKNGRVTSDIVHRAQKIDEKVAKRLGLPVPLRSSNKKSLQ